MEQRGGIEDMLEALFDPTRFRKLKRHMYNDLAPENIMFIEDLFLAHNRLKKPIIMKEYGYAVDFKHFKGKPGEDDDLPVSDIVGMNDLNELVFLKYMYKKYIKPDAPHELNIPSKFRKEITRLLIDERQPNLTIALYDNVRDEVLSMIYRNNYPKFRQSA
ncbi:hypothetical protein EDD86DRAFT_198388 [Gorgonomyces haynaldii]|nr:hypothetical protein EDD86DRAFT_198388 [Gorgonomyces haynaldii]